MIPVILLFAMGLLIGCAPMPWVQEGKSRLEARQDLAICAETLLREHKIKWDSSDEEKGKLMTACMEEKGYRRQS